LVRQTFEEIHDVGPFLLAHVEAEQEHALERVLAAYACIRAFADGAPPCGIVIEDFRERRDAAVVHVGRRGRDVAQGGRLEVAHVGARPVNSRIPTLFWIVALPPML
jgi:hypothetical protein